MSDPTTTSTTPSWLSALAGPIALGIRYLLILAAGALAKAGIAVFDTGTNSISIRLDDLAYAAAGGALLLVAVAWRWVAKRMGGKT